jgi:hypothetical protein
MDRTQTTAFMHRPLLHITMAAAVIAALTIPVRAAEAPLAMPQGALVCKAIEQAIEHARIVRQPTIAGLREYVEAQTGSGACRVIQAEVTAAIVDVDQRGFVLIEEVGQSGQWWTDAENLWGYYDTPAKVKAWKKK